MKKTWSPKWVGSAQPRKQRKYRHNAPLHARRKFLSAHLSKELRARFGKRAAVLRKGDEVVVMKGSFRKLRGNVERVDLKRTKVYVEGMKRKKVDGSEIGVPVDPSNVMITKLALEDKKRQAIFERAGRKMKPEKDSGQKTAKPPSGNAKAKKPEVKERAKPDGRKVKQEEESPPAEEEHVKKTEHDQTRKDVHHPRKPPEEEKEW